MRCLILLLLMLGAAHADQRIATIELNDGSVIRGEITALVNDTYAIESEALGRFQVRQDQVSAIRYGSGSAPAGGTGSEAGGGIDMASLQQQMAKDPQVMQMIQNLKDDPAIQGLLSDPAVQQALKSGDLGVLINDPRFLELLNHPQIRTITTTVSGQQ